MPIPLLPLQIVCEFLHVIDNILDVLQSHHAAFPTFGMAHCASDYVANLPTVEFLFMELLALPVLFDSVVLVLADQVLVVVLVDEAHEDSRHLFRLQLVVVQCDVDARLHCHVELCDLVGCEEEYPTVVFEDSEKHCSVLTTNRSFPLCRRSSYLIPVRSLQLMGQHSHRHFCSGERRRLHRCH